MKTPDKNEEKERPITSRNYVFPFLKGCLRHMVAVRQSHSKGPYKKCLSHRRHIIAWSKNTVTAAHKHIHGGID